VILFCYKLLAWGGDLPENLIDELEAKLHMFLTPALDEGETEIGG
jgi:hypothetical protein